LGFRPTPVGFKIHPRLPRDWPEVTITRLHLHDVVMDLTARADGTIVVRADRASDLPVVIELPKEDWRTRAPGAQVAGNRITLRLPPGLTELSPAR